jgi:hypothetical protein
MYDTDRSDLMDYSVINKTDIAYLEEMLFDKERNLQAVSFEYLKDVPQNDISYFCTKYGFYCIPTVELLLFLQREIGDETENTIEVGAGNGAISRYLGIRAFDNYMQESPSIKKYYDALQQATVPYGPNVIRMDGNSAVQKYKPKIVIGAYCTHKYNPKEHWREGNQFGFEEHKIIKKVDKYIHIGNEKVHGKKPILKYPHRIVKDDWLLSRSQHKGQNVIWIWEK